MIQDRPRKWVLTACACVALQTAAMAQGISGTILIKKRLTKPSVTAPVSVYQRGPSVQLSKDSGEDPIASERSRVVVYLEPASPAEGGSASSAGAEIRQADRRFIPDMVVVPVGSTVSFPNMDPIFHNIYSLSKAKSFDLGSYDKGKTRTVTFSKPGIVEVYCHLHPNMAATVVVAPNRWFARPDAEGHYRIPDVPPGHYTVVAWHKTAGFFRKTVSVGEGEQGTADFFIPIDIDAKAEPHSADGMHEAGSR